MIVHMIPGISVNDRRVVVVKQQALACGLNPQDHVEQGGSQNVVLIYLKDGSRRAGTVPDHYFVNLGGVDKVVRVSKSIVSIAAEGNGVPRCLKIGKDLIGSGQPCLLVAGPCTITEDSYAVIEKLVKMGVRHIRGGGHKPRTRPGSFYGLGEQGYKILFDAARMNGVCSVWTEVMDISHIEEVCRQRDWARYEGQVILWVGARTENQALLRELGLRNEFIIMLKNGLFDSSVTQMMDDASWVVAGTMAFDLDGKITDSGSEESGNQKVVFCVRGLEVKKFDEHSEYRFYPNPHWISALRQRTWAPICFDPCHICSNYTQIPDILRAGLRYGPDVVLLEAGPSPVDQGFPLDEFGVLINKVERLNQKITALKDAVREDLALVR